MRKVKFKVYVEGIGLGTGKVFDVVDMELNDECEKTISYYDVDEHDNEKILFTSTLSDKNIHLLQYTGLEDTNSNEIYDGYILKIVDDNIKNIATEFKLNDIVEVYFHDGCYFVKDEENNKEHLYILHHLSEVVGYIFRKNK